MRFAHVVRPGSDEPRLALVEGDEAVIVEELFDGAPRFLEELIAGGDDLLALVLENADRGTRHPLDGMGYASAVLAPPVILAIGLNYAAHSSELGLKTDSTPTVFVLWPNSLTGHDHTTIWPRSLSESVDYEAELGVIIGTPAKDVSPEDALAHVWGYTVVNDITARDIQYSEAQWSRCK
jgi:2-keto-4-pentenoate hydratase/2-oxohepta-3-ene-1,7-dioic acid hydratase in catechol pathway